MIKHDYDAFSEFEFDFQGAKAVLENLAESMFAPCGSKEYIKVVEAAIRLLENAEAWLEGGRVYEKEHPLHKEEDDGEEIS